MTREVYLKKLELQTRTSQRSDVEIEKTEDGYWQIRRRKASDKSSNINTPREKRDKKKTRRAWGVIILEKKIGNRDLWWILTVPGNSHEELIFFFRLF